MPGFEPTAEGVRAFRARYSLTQADLARELGVSVLTVSQWEAGRPVALPGVLRLGLVALAGILRRRRAALRRVAS